MLCRFKRLIYPKTPPAEDSGYRIVLYQPCETVRDAAGHLVTEVKAVGFFLPTGENRSYELKGRWGRDSKYGVQFEVEDYGKDFQFVECADMACSAGMMEELYLREAGRFGVDNVALLSPFRKKTETGVNALNPKLREWINPKAPDKPEISHGKRLFRLGDKVMQVRNFQDISNGHIGYGAAV